MISQVKQEKPQLSIRQLCETLEVNRRWYYARLAQGETAGPDVELRDAIEQIILEFAGYGYRRVTHALVRAGWSVNHKRVLRIMREESLLCHLKRQFVPTTDSHHPFQVYPNLVKGLEVDAPDVVWVADITYIREAPQLCLPGDFARRLFTQMRRMEPVQAHRYATGAGSFGKSPGDSRCETRTHSPFRSWRPVCQYRLCRAIAECASQDQYVSGG